jgi:hypothetical protein
MLLFIRAVFWLSVVAYFLPWPENPIASLLAKRELQSAAQEFWGRTAAMPQAAAEREYLRAPEACLEGAPRLGRMAAGHPPFGKDKALTPCPLMRPRPGIK